MVLLVPIQMCALYMTVIKRSYRQSRLCNKTRTMHSLGQICRIGGVCGTWEQISIHTSTCSRGCESRIKSESFIRCGGNWTQARGDIWRKKVKNHRRKTTPLRRGCLLLENSILRV